MVWESHTYTEHMELAVPMLAGTGTTTKVYIEKEREDPTRKNSKIQGNRKDSNKQLLRTVQKSLAS
jgi:hypothetical protein